MTAATLSYTIDAVIARLRELAQLVQADADNAELISRCRQVEPIEVPE